MTIDAALWPYLLVILAGFLPTEIWRSLAVVFVRGLDEDSELLILVRAVATALLAAVVARLVLIPPGELIAVPLAIRIGAVAGGFLVYLLARRSVFLGIMFGEIVIIAGAWYAG
jgi:Branched-chain amino acid transport protein (AzlD)